MGRHLKQREDRRYSGDGLGIICGHAGPMGMQEGNILIQ